MLLNIESGDGLAILPRSGIHRLHNPHIQALSLHTDLARLYLLAVWRRGASPLVKQIVFETRKESNPCSLCAKMRKGALNLEAKAAGCNKIAYAHHKDDIIETMLLSLMFEGRFYTFPPKTFLDRTELTVIRPLMYVSEADVIGFKNKYNLPVCKNPCPADGHTKREYVKNLTKQLNRENPGIKERLFHAVTSGNIEGWNSGNIGMAGTSEEVADKTCRSETSVKMQSDQTGAEEQLSESHNCHENDRESKNKKEEF